MAGFDDPAAGAPPRDAQLVVIAVGAVVSQADRHPGSLGHDRAFRPFLALSVGLGPVFPWPSGALVMAPSTERKLQSMPTCSSYSKSPSRQNSWNTFARSHSWKRRWAEELEQMPVTFRAFHCMPVRKTKRMAFMALRSGTLGRWQPK